MLPIGRFLLELELLCLGAFLLTVGASSLTSQAFVRCEKMPLLICFPSHESSGVHCLVGISAQKERISPPHLPPPPTPPPSRTNPSLVDLSFCVFPCFAVFGGPKIPKCLGKTARNVSLLRSFLCAASASKN